MAELSPVETLRAAAAKLRERAKNAEGGPWAGADEPLAEWLERCYRTYRGWRTWPQEAQNAYAVARVLLGVPDA